NTIVITGFSGGDAFFDQTCTITSVTSTGVLCALVHGNASSTTFGIIANNSVGPFVAADVGKSIMGFGTCVDDTTSAVAGGGIISTTTTPPIATSINTTQVTISATPANSATANQAFPQGSCFVWGHLDDTAATTLDNAMQLSSVCPKLFMASGNYFFQSP